MESIGNRRDNQIYGIHTDERDENHIAKKRDARIARWLDCQTSLSASSWTDNGNEAALGITQHWRRVANSVSRPMSGVTGIEICLDKELGN